MMDNPAFYGIVFIVGWFIGMIHQDLRIAMNPDNLIHTKTRDDRT